MRKAFKIFVAKPEYKRPVGRPRNGWEDNFKVEFSKIF